MESRRGPSSSDREIRLCRSNVYYLDRLPVGNWTKQDGYFAPEIKYISTPWYDAEICVSRGQHSQKRMGSACKPFLGKSSEL